MGGGGGANLGTDRFIGAGGGCMREATMHLKVILGGGGGAGPPTPM